MNNINPQDLQLKLLSKNPIMIDKVPIYPVSLDIISDIGYIKFNQFLRIFCIKSDYASEINGKEIPDNELFNFIVMVILSDKYTYQDCKLTYNPLELKLNDFYYCPKCKSDHINNFTLDLFNEWLSVICRQPVSFSYERCSFIIGENDDKQNIVEINSSNFLDIQEIIRKRNGIDESANEDEDKENPADEKAKQWLEKKKRLDEKIKKLKKQSDDESLTIGDLVSILAGGMKLPLSTVMEYDMYQFNDQFNRLRIFDDYQVNIQALLHGAKSEDINIQHWISKIKKPNED
jgi:hypothetical protein